MEFSFQKYIQKIGLFYLLIACFFLGFVLFAIPKEVVAIFLIPVFAMIVYYIYKFHQIYSSMKQFLDSKSKEKIEKIELEMNNCLLKYQKWYLTDTYLFNLDKFVMIAYEEIILVEDSWTFKMTYRHGGLTKIVTIYLKNGERYSCEIGLNGNIYKLTEIIQTGNPDVFIGSKTKYKKEIKEKYGIDI